MHTGYQDIKEGSQLQQPRSTEGKRVNTKTRSWAMNREQEKGIEETPKRTHNRRRGESAAGARSKRNGKRKNAPREKSGRQKKGN